MHVFFYIVLEKVRHFKKDKKYPHVEQEAEERYEVDLKKRTDFSHVCRIQEG